MQPVDVAVAIREEAVETARPAVNDLSHTLPWHAKRRFSNDAKSPFNNCHPGELQKLIRDAIDRGELLSGRHSRKMDAARP
jgi:hypothetical protein